MSCSCIMFTSYFSNVYVCPILFSSPRHLWNIWCFLRFMAMAVVSLETEKKTVFQYVVTVLMVMLHTTAWSQIHRGLHSGQLLPRRQKPELLLLKDRAAPKESCPEGEDRAGSQLRKGPHISRCSSDHPNHVDIFSSVSMGEEALVQCN